ncbi:LOW QUALITY PROTEIN: A-kinase anchor protein 3 [Pterocles gutturalis]
MNTVALPEEFFLEMLRKIKIFQPVAGTKRTRECCEVDHYVLGEEKSRTTGERKTPSQKRFGQDEFANNLSKKILFYANTVVSVMVVSVMKTIEGQANDSNVACIVLKLFTLRHSKAVVSDFVIDSSMKNLRDITDKVLTNSYFASSEKLTPFTLGSCKAAETQAILNNLHSTLIVQNPGKDNVHASVKTGSRTDTKAQRKFAAARTETLKEKEMTCADAVGNHIIKQGVTLWHEKKNQCSQCSEDSSSAQYIGSLVDTVLKLCLIIVKYINPESLLAESGSREDHRKQLFTYCHRSIWQPLKNLFTENQLQKLSSVAVEKGYKVREILQAMLKYKTERQSGEAVGNSVRLPVLNCLLNNS